MNNNRFCRLPDGTWGAKIFGPIQPGQNVALRRKDGTESIQTIKAVLENNGIISICTLVGKRSTTTKVGGRCADCGAWSRRLIFCRDSNGIGGDCCPRCARLSQYERSFA